MANWHQKNLPQLWHESKWSVVEDANQTCVSRFSTSDEANTYLNGLIKHGNGRGAYVLPPMQHQMRRG